MTGREILESIRAEFKDGTKLVRSTGAEHLIRLPFTDQMGDPVEIGVSVVDDRAFLDDAGAIAGLLFSLGQDEEETPACRLLTDLTRTHGLELDYQEGLVRIRTPREQLSQGAATLVKVVLTMLTATPHIRVPTNRNPVPR